MHGSTSYDSWIPFKVHQFLDITCKIGGFNVYHKQKQLIQLFKHPEFYTSNIFVTSILVMRLTGYFLLPQYHCENKYQRFIVKRL